MDIWHWIESLDDDISDSMYDLAGAVSDAEHDRVDGLVPMIVGIARERGLPWVEVYARHWELQSLIFHRYDPRKSVPRAIDLLERSHRDDAIDCPQTICVSQDVCAAYGMADGPGYAHERIAVSEETLEKINPAWSCWTCITAEKAAAMIDLGQSEAALTFIEENEGHIAIAGGDPESIDMRRIKIEALRKLGRYEEGLELARAAVADRQNGEAFTFECNALAVQMLAQLGRYDEATKELPALEDVLDRGRTDVHGDTLAALIRNGAVPFDDERIRAFARMTQRDIDRGAFYMAANVAVQAAELSADEGRSDVGCAFAELAAEAISRLRAKDATSARLDAAVARFPTAADEVPDIDHWQELGFLNKATAMARTSYQASPDTLELFEQLAGLYLDTHAYDDLRSLLDDTPDSDNLKPSLMWYRSFLEERTKGREAAIECMRELTGEYPNWGGANWRLAFLLDAAGQHPEALATYNRTIELFEESGSYDWERMVVAARIGEHDIVRHSASRLDIKLETDTGPIDEDWGGCVVHYEDDTYLFSTRTGPVTARIERLARYGAPERYKDEVVIMPRPENPDADENTYWVYPHVQTVKAGQFRSFMLDGVHPGDENLTRIRSKLEEEGFIFEQKSTEHYRLTDPDSGEGVAGVFARIGVPAERNPIDVHKLLSQVVDEFDIEILTWLDLLHELKLEDDIAKQNDIARAWGI